MPGAAALEVEAVVVDGAAERVSREFAEERDGFRVVRTLGEDCAEPATDKRFDFTGERAEALEGVGVGRVVVVDGGRVADGGRAGGVAAADCDAFPAVESLDEAVVLLVVPTVESLEDCEGAFESPTLDGRGLELVVAAFGAAALGATGRVVAFGVGCEMI